MRWPNLSRMLWALTTVSLAIAQPVYAQTSNSAIVGVVRDNAGLVLPGVTVEVESPALIGGKRVTSTSTDGAYQVLDLRPGTYAVTFSMPRFTSQRHEGIALVSAFTASANAVLEIAGVKEAVTVVAADSAAIDVKTTASSVVLTQFVKESIPTGRTVGGLLAMLPGATATRVDVGGNFGLLNPSVQVHGSDGNDQSWNMDGFDVSSTLGSGGVSGAYYNTGLQEELVVRTEALPAEIAAGGVYINMVSKSGSNTFSGTLFASGTTEALQSANLTDALRSRGVLATTRVSRMLDINPGFGGPIVRDRLWFYGSYRYHQVNRLVANQFLPDGTQAPDDSDNRNISFSLTAQLPKGNRLYVNFDRGSKRNLHTRQGGGISFPGGGYPAAVDITASYKQNTKPVMGNLRWTSVLGPRLFLEAGASRAYNYSEGLYADQAEDLPRLDIGRGTLFGATSAETFFLPTRRMASLMASYTPSWKGAHSIKAGVQLQVNRFDYEVPANGRGDLIAIYRNGVPNSVRVFNYPIDEKNSWKDLGVFVQDSWTLRNRLSLNLGLRVERLVGRVDAQRAPAGTWVGARQFTEVTNVPNWTTVVPRLGFSYDPTGKGKTAIKVSASRYTQRIGSSYMRAVNPMAQAADTRPWNDLNGDRRPQLAEIGSSTGFVGGVGARYDPNIKRPYQWEYMVSLQHEIMRTLGVKLSYYHRNWYDQIASKNLLVPTAGYSPVVISNPLTGAPLTVYNQDPLTRGRQDRFIYNEPAITKYYSAIELVVDKRFTGRWMAMGGLTIGRKKGTVTTSDMNNPNLLINNTGNLGADAPVTFTLSGLYVLPADIRVSSHFRYSTGLPLLRDFVVTRTQVPNLTQVTQGVVLVPPGEVRLANVKLLDIRLSKVFSTNSRVKVEPLIDLYNVLNVNAPVFENQRVGPNVGNVTETVDGRLLKVGLRLTF